MSTVSANQEHSKQSLSGHEILRIAELDAEQAYGDLSEFQITLVRQADDWHVDYELTEEMVAGGGPHYVIDPVTGTILWKTYEQ